MKKFNLKTYIKTQLQEGFTQHHQEEIDALLDKVAKFGIEGISQGEKRRLQRLSNDDPGTLDVLHDENPIQDRVEQITPPGVGRYAPKAIITHKLREPGWDWSHVNPKHIDMVAQGPDAPYYEVAWNEIQNTVLIHKNGEDMQIMGTPEHGVWIVPRDVNEKELIQWLTS